MRLWRDELNEYFEGYHLEEMIAQNKYICTHHADAVVHDEEPVTTTSECMKTYIFDITLSFVHLKITHLIFRRTPK